VPPLLPPAWVERAESRLPVRPNNEGPTQGEVFNTSGKNLQAERIHSGDKPSLLHDLTLNREQRLSRSMRGHVEAQVAADMRHGDLPDQVVLVINNVMCGGPLSCRELVESILEPGQRLIVYERGTGGELVPDPVVLVGTGERIRR
jgi:hypothetical protein